jgi:hypothetical protein
MDSNYYIYLDFFFKFNLRKCTARVMYLILSRPSSCNINILIFMRQVQMGLVLLNKKTTLNYVIFTNNCINPLYTMPHDFMKQSSLI